MTHLRILQSDSAIEQVSSAVIAKLYELATSGNLDNTSYLQGRLHTQATYLSYIDSIRAEYPDVYITSDKYYLYMGDPTLTLIMATRYGDGVGCVLSDCLNVRSTVEDVFGGLSGNTSITDATGMKYFTNISWSGSHSNYHNGFKDCTNLLRCELPEGMTILSAGNGYGNLGFFLHCSNLTYVKLPSTLTIIDQYSFGGCTSLLNIDIPSNVTTIGYCAFENCGLQSVTLPSGLTTIDSWAFSGNNITSLYIPSSVTTIGSAFLSNCTNITSIIFDLNTGNNLTMLSGGGHLRGAFSTVNLPGITTLDFPERLTTMDSGDYFFCNLPNLTTVIFRGSTPPTCTGSSASFWINNNAIFYVPDNSVSTYQSATVFSSYASRIRGISELPT